MSDSHFRSCYVISNLKRLPTALKGSLSESHRDFPMKTLSPTFTSPAFSTLMFTPKNGADPKTFFSSGSLNEINQDKTSSLQIYGTPLVCFHHLCQTLVHRYFRRVFKGSPPLCLSPTDGSTSTYLFQWCAVFNCSWLDCPI